MSTSGSRSHAVQSRRGFCAPGGDLGGDWSPHVIPLGNLGECLGGKIPDLPGQRHQRLVQMVGQGT